MATESKVMELKQKAASEQTNKVRPVDWVGEVKSEFSKISWTTREELILYTKIVLGATVIFGFGIYCVDLMIRGGLELMGALVKLIG